MNWAHGGSEVPGLACRGPGASTDSPADALPEVQAALMGPHRRGFRPPQEGRDMSFPS